MKNMFFSKQNLLRIGVKYSQVFSNYKWLMALLLVVSAAGCKKISEEDGLHGICPEVTSTSPANSASGVNLNAKVVATFNEKIDSSTITTSTFTVKQGTTAVPGYVSYS